MEYYLPCMWVGDNVDMSALDFGPIGTQTTLPVRDGDPVPKANPIGFIWRDDEETQPNP